MDETHYRAQAQLYREQALLHWGHPATAAVWTRMAEHYDRLAQQAAEAIGPGSPQPTAPQRQQPQRSQQQQRLQQQQAKKKEDET
jgi:hypothetical protein